MTDKLQLIIDNYINGNISDAKNAVKKLRKSELIMLIWKFHSITDNLHESVKTVDCLTV